MEYYNPYTPKPSEQVIQPGQLQVGLREEALAQLQQESAARAARLQELESEIQDAADCVQVQQELARVQERKIGSLRRQVTLANRKLQKRRQEVREYHKIIEEYKQRCPMPLPEELRREYSTCTNIVDESGEILFQVGVPLETYREQMNPEVALSVSKVGMFRMDGDVASALRERLAGYEQRVAEIREYLDSTKTVRLNRKEIEKTLKDAKAMGRPLFPVQPQIDFVLDLLFPIQQEQL